MKMAPAITITTGDSGRMCRGDGDRFSTAICRLVYGRIRPPADAADAERIPGFLAAIGPDGPMGYATNVTIEETNDPDTGHPRSIVVTGRSSSLDLAMELTVDNTLVTKTGAGLFGGGMDFLQLRTSYRVRGRAGGRSIDFTAAGTAETFRGR